MSVELTVPEIGESLTSVYIGRWLKSPGEAVQAGEAVVEIDSEKASMEVPSPVNGVLVEALVAEGDEVPIGAPIARIEPGAAQSLEGAGAQAPAKDASPGVRAGPAARQLATQTGTDLTALTGTGRGGRVTTTDVRRSADPPSASPTVPSRTPQEERVRAVRMSPFRRTIARRLIEAQRTAAILTTFNEVDMSGVMALRAKYRDAFLEAHGVKLGFMSFFVKATIEALKAFPAVNAEIDGDSVLYKDFYNLGVAV